MIRLLFFLIIPAFLLQGKGVDTTIYLQQDALSSTEQDLLKRVLKRSELTKITLKNSTAATPEQFPALQFQVAKINQQIHMRLFYYPSSKDHHNRKLLILPAPLTEGALTTKLPLLLKKVMIDTLCNSPSSCLSKGKALQKSKQFQQAKKHYQHACKLKNAGGCALTALFFMKGKGGAVNLSKATDYLEKGCILNHAPSCFLAGKHYMKGKGTGKNLKKGSDYLKKACSLNKRFCR